MFEYMGLVFRIDIQVKDKNFGVVVGRIMMPYKCPCLESLIL